MDKAANQLFTVLGELKGGAMKVGQALSVMEAAIPEAIRQALPRSADQAAEGRAAAARRQSAPGARRTAGHQVAPAVRRRSTTRPVASASIGQVHKAVWSDGREVAVKIQYPGADEALRADLKTMQRMIGVCSSSSPPAPTCRAWSTS